MKSKYIRNDHFDISDVEFFIGQGIEEPFAKVLSSRGVTAANYDDFVAPVFHDPYAMRHMDAAAEVVRKTTESGEPILIYGDYDADGLSAAALLSLYFTHNGTENDVIVPTREEGYGLHAEKVFAAFGKKKYGLIVTVDCGISNREEIAKIREQLGDIVLVTDHHEIPETLPDCICLNPKLGYPFPYLSGSGVAYKLVEALAGSETAAQYADLAIIGTIGDVMPLLDENRALVMLGLSRFRHKGLRKLAEMSYCGPTLTASDIAMKIAPKINAAGRVGDPRVALQLLLSCEKVDTGICEKLTELNDLRRRLTEEITAEAARQCDKRQVRRERLVFLTGENWQHGILGLVANRFRSDYNVPALVATADGDDFVGSARGIEGVDLYALFAGAADLLVKFGGHKASVGFTVAKENVVALRRRLSEQLSLLDADLFREQIVYDMDIDGETSLADLMDFADFLQPLLPSEQMTYRVKGTAKYAGLFGKGNHLSITLSTGLELKAFYNFASFLPALQTGAEIDAVCTLETDAYSGTVCGIVKHLTLCNSLHFDELYGENYLRNLSFDTAPVSVVNKEEAAEILQKDGTLAVFDTYKQFLRFQKEYDFEEYTAEFFCRQGTTKKCVVISPDAHFDYSDYENILIFGHYGDIRRTYCEGAVYVAQTSECFLTTEIDRNVCAAVYTALKNKSKFDSVETCFTKYLVGKCDRIQYFTAIKVFEELHLLERKDEYDLTFRAGKFDLFQSGLFRKFQTR